MAEPHTPLSFSLYRQPRERFLYLYVTNACGLRCRHCYVGNDRLNAAATMTVEFAVAVMDYFKAFGGHDKLYILGGEPTIHRDLPDIVRAAHDRGYSVTISSNGDFGDELFDRIPPTLIASFNFSLESWNPATHASIRGRTDNFQKVTDRIKTARRLGYQVRVMCTISKANVHEALGMVTFVEALGAHSLSFHNLGQTGNAVKHLTPLSPVEWMAFCSSIEALPQPKDLAVFYPPTYVDASDQQKWSDRGYPGCPARTLDRPHVYPDGTVYACPLLMDGQRHFARFESGQLRLNTSEASELHTYLRVDPVCLGCSATQTCGGGCPAYASLPPHPDGRYVCDRKITPLCILWTTHAWQAPPQPRLHEFR
jgi:radical SAM protein with 4Fe4S-binding SPASM domain